MKKTKEKTLIKQISIIALIIVVIIGIIMLKKTNIIEKITQSKEKYTIEKAQTKLEKAIEELKTEQEQKEEQITKDDLGKIDNEEIDVRNTENFPIEAICENYKFNIDENYKVTYIEEAKGTKVTYETEVGAKAYTNKDEVNILIKTVNEKGIERIEYPDGNKIQCKGRTKVGIDYCVNKNGKYKFKIIDIEGVEIEKDVVIDKIDKKEPTEFTPEVEVNGSSITIIENGKDGKKDEQSTKSGISHYEYYLIDENNNTKKYETNKIEGLLGSYQVYIIAYDKAGNKKKSNIVEINVVTVLKVDAGSAWNLAIDSTGNLWAWGENNSIFLEDGTMKSNIPKKVNTKTKFKEISAGQSHSLAIDKEGKLWGCGGNSKGELGNGTTTSTGIAIPITIKEETKFKEISAGQSHSLAIDEEGNLWTWGGNGYGQLGIGVTNNSANIPRQIKSGTKFKKISTKYDSNLAIDEEGSLWAWGRNDYGQLGTNKTNKTQATPVKIKAETKFKEISAGNNHSLAIDEEGNLWTWGYNSNGQLGNGTTTNSSMPVKINSETKFKEIVAGGMHSLAIDEEGNLWAWGYNGHGQVGNETQIDSSIPIKIKEETKFKKISAGYEHSLGIDEEENLFAWGSYYLTTLGCGSDINQCEPIEIQSEKKYVKISSYNNLCLAIDEEKKLWGWGGDYYKQFGNAIDRVGDQRYFSIPVKINEEAEFKEISVGVSHTLAIDEEGKIWGWGVNNSGQLGNGITTNDIISIPIQINIERKFKDIATGQNHSLAIDEEGNLWTWGRNAEGQLGNGSTILSKIPIQIKEGTKFKKISAGEKHSLAIDEEGNLWIWGSNSSGLLGNGATTSIVPIQIKEGTKFKEISANNNSNLAIDEEGNIWSWGQNNYGQLGNGTTTNISIPIQIKEGIKFKKISAGSNHSLAIDEEGKIWGWGLNNYGQLGNGTATNDGISISKPIQIKGEIKYKEVLVDNSVSFVKDTNGIIYGMGNIYYLGNKNLISLKPQKISLK